MNTGRVYLDWNATAPLLPQARETLVAALDAANPSSVHREGQRARAIVETARAAVAALVGAAPQNVTFTSGGTEANALALAGRETLLVSAIEHPSVLAGGRFAKVQPIPVTADGRVEPDAVARLLSATSGPALVSVMLANNETGVIQPIPAIADVVHAAGGLLHVDAVQAAGRITIVMGELGADLLTLSAHKIGGPKGVGALVRRSEAVRLAPLIAGGGQERGLRAGTENVAGIAGFGAAAALGTERLAGDAAAVRRRRTRLEARLSEIAPDTVVFGQSAERLPNTTLFAVPGIKAETALIALDLAGFAVSSGSACSSGKVGPSHVLAAMGVPPELAGGALRISIGRTTSEDEIEAFCEAWKRVLASLTREHRSMAA